MTFNRHKNKNDCLHEYFVFILLKSVTLYMGRTVIKEQENKSLNLLG